MPIFHYAPIRLGAGSVIEPGNFGRIIKRYQANDTLGGWRMARELIFEMMRPVAKPSRLTSCFGLPSQHDADLYRKFNDTNFIWILHEVEIVDPHLPQHIGGLSWIDFPPAGSPILDPMRMQAKSYWDGAAGTPEKGNEIVTASQLRVLCCLE